MVRDSNGRTHTQSGEYGVEHHSDEPPDADLHQTMPSPLIMSHARTHKLDENGMPKVSRWEYAPNALRHQITPSQIRYAFDHPIDRELYRQGEWMYVRMIGRIRDPLTPTVEVVAQVNLSGVAVVYHAMPEQGGFWKRPFDQWIRKG